MAGTAAAAAATATETQGATLIDRTDRRAALGRGAGREGLGFCGTLRGWSRARAQPLCALLGSAAQRIGRSCAAASRKVLRKPARHARIDRLPEGTTAGGESEKEGEPGAG
jgi:hypothetical protein